MRRGNADPRARFVLACMLSAMSAPRRAAAHQTSVTYVDVDVRGRDVDVEARIGAADLGEPLGRSPLVAVSRAQAEAGAARAAQYVADRIVVTNGGARCEPAPGTAALRDRPDDFVLATTVRYHCARQVDDLAVRYELFFELDPRHQGLAEVNAFGAQRAFAFRAGDRVLRVQGRPSALAQFRDYLLLGVEHIFTGYDHLAFLLGLLVIAGARGARSGARYALGVVTAFTVAHSLTLAAAALGWVRLPSRLVESAIAASILYVALENVRTESPPRRWALTFCFGLVHGFGFASVLAEIGLPRAGLLASLLAFNLGVEAGQLLVVAAAFPALLLIHRARWDARSVAALAGLASVAFVALGSAGVDQRTLWLVLGLGVPALALAGARFGYARGVRRGGSLVLAALATLWLAERMFNRVLLGGVLG